MDNQGHSIHNTHRGPTQIFGNLDMNSNNIQNVADPVNPQDAATKTYADSAIGSHTLQEVYDISTQPQILTDATRLALTIQRGSGADTDDVLQLLNGAGSQVLGFTAEGSINVIDKPITWTGDAAANVTLINSNSPGSLTQERNIRLIHTNASTLNFETYTDGGARDSYALVIDHDGGGPNSNSAHIGINKAAPTVSLDVEGNSKFAGNLECTGVLLSGQSEIKIGLASAAGGDYAIAIGQSSSSSAEKSLCLGYDSTANGISSISIGNTCHTGSGTNNVCIGTNAGDVALSGNDNIFVGQLAGDFVTSGSNNIIVGRNSDCVATSDNQIALGQNSLCTGARAIAVGSNVSAGTDECVIGDTNLNVIKTTTTNVCDLGSTGVKWKDGYFAGNLDIDGIIASGQSQIKIGSSSTATGTRATAVGNSTTASGLESIAIGNSASSTTTASLSLGNGADCLGAYSVAIGNAVECGGSYSVIIGHQAGGTITGIFNVGIGSASLNACTEGVNNTCIGRNSGTYITTGDYNVCLGEGATPNSGSGGINNSIMIGRNVTTTASNTITIGDSAMTILKTEGNGTCDLGGTSNKFKDLWLSGDAHIDGTVDGVDLAAIQSNYVGRLFSQVNERVIQNTVNITGIGNTSGAVGSASLPANSLVIGDVITMKCSGNIKTNGAVSITVDPELGGSSAFSSKSVTVNEATAVLYDFEYRIAIITLGSSGTCRPTCRLKVYDSSNQFIEWSLSSTLTINTTTVTAVDATVEFGAADANNIFRTSIWTITKE